VRVFVQSIVPCQASLAWNEVQTTRLLAEICSPLIRLAPAVGETAFPEQWADLNGVRLRTYMFGVIPLGTRTLGLEKVDPQEFEIQTREYDALIRRWDHRIHVEPIDAGHCRYTDDVEIDAGWLTFPVWLFAQWFYRHRQHRWQRVARRLQAVPGRQPALAKASEPS
jgi:hypothetical protein